MSNSLEEDLEQLYIDGYKKGRADERERCVQKAESCKTDGKFDQSFNESDVINETINEVIEAIKAD